jgi:putative transposase
MVDAASASRAGGHQPTSHAVVQSEDVEWQAGDRRYLSEGSMALLYPDSDNGAIAAIDSGE